MPNKTNLICRTCLRANNSCFDIFNYYEREKLLSELLIECTSVKVEKQDELPQYMCNNCVEKLISAWDFKVMVVNSDLKFRCNLEIKSENIEIARVTEEITIKYEKLDLPDVSVKDCDTNGILADEHGEDLNSKLQNVIEEDDTESVMNNVVENPTTSDTEIYSTLEIQSPDDRYTFNDKGSNSKFEDITKEDDTESVTNNTVENPTTSDTKIYSTLEIQSPDDGYTFNDKGVPLTKDGRKLTGRERENVPIYCKHCNRSFRWKYYKVHLKLHQGDKPFKCDQCDSAFVQAHQLRIHHRVHTDEAPFSCDICGKTFKQLQNVHLHKAKHTEDRPHKCEICDKRFKQIHVLKQHLRQHDKDKWYMCELCGKSFTNSASFSAHKNTHMTGKTYPCPICDKEFPSPTHMKRHKRVTHSDKKPYVCNYCGRRFKELFPLKRHILIHTGEKPYSCNICAKTFRQRECLTAHMRSHTGETPYVCEQCPAKFKFLHLLKKHKTVHDT